jgi:hypothetical protein
LNKKLRYFFNDYQSNFCAPKSFVRSTLTSLHYKNFDRRDFLLRIGDEAEEIFFIR